MSTLFFDDFYVGKTYSSPTRTITETDIVMFASMSGDMNELHTSETFASKNNFGKRIAHGLLGLSVCHGLIFRMGIFDGSAIAFLTLDNWVFTNPIFIGDTVYTTVTVDNTKKSRSKDDRGVVNFSIKLINQHGDVVQKGSKTLMFKRK